MRQPYPGSLEWSFEARVTPANAAVMWGILLVPPVIAFAWSGVLCLTGNVSLARFESWSGFLQEPLLFMVGATVFTAVPLSVAIDETRIRLRAPLRTFIHPWSDLQSAVMKLSPTRGPLASDRGTIVLRFSKRAYQIRVAAFAASRRAKLLDAIRVACQGVGHELQPYRARQRPLTTDELRKVGRLLIGAAIVLGLVGLLLLYLVGYDSVEVAVAFAFVCLLLGLFLKRRAHRQSAE